jgi:hypothetical protein
LGGLCSVSVAKVVHLALLSISHTQVSTLERHLSGTKGIGRHPGMRVSSGITRSYIQVVWWPCRVGVS